MIVLGLIVMLAGSGLSLAIGGAELDARTIWAALLHYDSGNLHHQVIHDSRLPRTLAALLIGAALGVSGALLQAVTRNALAAPDTLGVQAGAGLALLISLVYIPSIPTALLPASAFAGGMLAMLLVWTIASLGGRGMTAIKLALAGVVVSALAGTLIETLLLSHSRMAFTLSYLLKGSLSGIQWRELEMTVPWIGMSLLIAAVLAHKLNILSLGEEAAAGLGASVSAVRAAATLAAVILASASVAVAGSVVFLGLMAPHLAQMTVGVDWRWRVPVSGLLGAMLLVWTDVLTRLWFAPQEVTVSIMLALTGAPLFIYIVRSRGIRS